PKGTGSISRSGSAGLSGAAAVEGSGGAGAEAAGEAPPQAVSASGKVTRRERRRLWPRSIVRGYSMQGDGRASSRPRARRDRRGRELGESSVRGGRNDVDAAAVERAR